MIRKIAAVSISLLICLSLAGQDEKYIVAFYNVENLFDIYDDPSVLDEEFTPEGPKNWTEAKYEKKIGNLAEVIYGLSASNKDFPAVIGLAEVENHRVLDDLVSAEKLVPARYQIVHYDSPEARGVDVALLFRPDLFEYEWSKAFQPVIPEEPDFKTRDILAVCGRMGGDRICFLVNHWSSRRGGAQSSEFLRVGCASTVRRFTDSLQAADPDIKIVIMGDMNDDPDNRSLSEVLGAVEKISKVKDGGFFNPFWSMHRAGYGTLGYQDAWNLFDNIIVNSALTDNTAGHLRLLKSAKSGFYGHIYKRNYMIQQSGRYKNYPLRTFSGNTFLGGYSDHLPVYIILGK